MKRTNPKNIRIVRQILSKLTGEVRRKTVLEAAAAKGLIENDTWPVIKPAAKGAARGHYSVIKMIALADAILIKGKKSEPAAAITEVAKETEAASFDESGLSEVASPDHEEKIQDSNVWGEIPYTEEDVADELSLMGTYFD